MPRRAAADRHGSVETGGQIDPLDKMDGAVFDKMCIRPAV